ncbi:hypothetical protein B0H12DRAFT_1179770 [Mycena haematopus]|nr:hypothetical protein B0H12DRAFT_1179770 [Mycena haematopus]
MNTFSAFCFAARTVLHPGRHPHFACFNPIALHPRAHVRFKHKHKGPTPLPRDEKIPHEEVSVVQEDNSLFKTSLKSLLQSLDRTKVWVELVAVVPQPVVKIVEKKAAVAAQKKLRERQRVSARKNTVKEVQLTWGSEPGDLEHKLDRVRSLLEIGVKVDIVFSTKPKTLPPSVAVQQAKVKDTIESLADISKEWKPAEWRKDMAAIFLQGKVDPDNKLAPEQVNLAEGKGMEEVKPVTEVEDEGISETAPPAPPTPTPRLHQHVQHADLSALGFTPPPKRRDPLKALKDVKKYGERKFNKKP